MPNPTNFRNRIGTFSITPDFLDQALHLEDSPYHAIMNQCVIMKCEFNYPHFRFDYVAASHLFDEVPDGVVPPKYTWEIRENGDAVPVRRLHE